MVCLDPCLTCTCPTFPRKPHNLFAQSPKLRQQKTRFLQNGMVDQKNVLTKCLLFLEKCPWNGTWVKPFHSGNVHRDTFQRISAYFSVFQHSDFCSVFLLPPSATLAAPPPLQQAWLFAEILPPVLLQQPVELALQLSAVQYRREFLGESNQLRLFFSADMCFQWAKRRGHNSLNQNISK